MKRALMAMIVAFGWPILAAAQSRAAAPAPLPVLPPIGLPLAPIGLPLAPIGIPLTTAAPADSGGSTPHDRGSRGDRRHDGHGRPSFAYIVPAYDWPLPTYGAPAYDTVVSTANPAPAPPTNGFGRLHLDIDAAGQVQVLVDGYYAGTLAELNNELELEPGPHRVEFRAAGYEPLSADIRIQAARAIGYRAALTPSTPSATPESPAPRSTIYFIPGCYLGNVHPSEVALPSGCDLTKLVIRQP